jgi:hypothetical protein
MWVLIGHGANDLQIPALIFSDHESAKTKCREIFGCDPTEGKGGRFYWEVDEEDHNTIRKMYTRYYNGNGGVYRAELREVAPGAPFVGFDLD